MNLLSCYIIAGIIFVSIIGTLSHFFYEWSGRNKLIGLFTPVSESTWEHIKLLFFPMLLYSFFMIWKLRTLYPCIASAAFTGILLGSALIPLIFYTYSGFLGQHILSLDIATFLVSVAAAFYKTYKLTLSCSSSGVSLILKAAIFFLTAAFLLFTYLPPSLGLFRDPTKG